MDLGTKSGRRQFGGFGGSNVGHDRSLELRKEINCISQSAVTFQRVAAFCFTRYGSATSKTFSCAVPVASTQPFTIWMRWSGVGLPGVAGILHRQHGEDGLFDDGPDLGTHGRAVAIARLREVRVAAHVSRVLAGEEAHEWRGPLVPNVSRRRMAAKIASREFSSAQTRRDHPSCLACRAPPGASWRRPACRRSRRRGRVVVLADVPGRRRCGCRWSAMMPRRNGFTPIRCSCTRPSLSALRTKPRRRVERLVSGPERDQRRPARRSRSRTARRSNRRPAGTRSCPCAGRSRPAAPSPRGSPRRRR